MGFGISLLNLQRSKGGQGRLPGGGSPVLNDEMGLVRRRGGMDKEAFTAFHSRQLQGVYKSLGGQSKPGSGELKATPWERERRRTEGLKEFPGTSSLWGVKNSRPRLHGAKYQ